jgi:long-chain acyl-CoA synthetase
MVRRGVIADKYASIIDAVYAGEERIEIDATIAFQDGTRQRVRTTIAVVGLAPATAHKSARAAA